MRKRQHLALVQPSREPAAVDLPIAPRLGRSGDLVSHDPVIQAVDSILTRLEKKFRKMDRGRI